jgi:hypothetical protein
MFDDKCGRSEVFLGGSAVREVTCGSAGRPHLDAEVCRGASSAVSSPQSIAGRIL